MLEPMLIRAGATAYDRLVDAGRVSGEDITTFGPRARAHPCNPPPHSACHVHHMLTSTAEINQLARII
jgi:hypothetical protein